LQRRRPGKILQPNAFQAPRNARDIIPLVSGTHSAPRWRQVIADAVLRLRSGIHARDLRRLAVLYGTDKGTVHDYMGQYQRHFESLRLRKMNILEIGVGGYANSGIGGASLRMWKAYFPNASIHGIDLHDKRAFEEPRIHIFQGDQSNPAFLLDTYRKIGSLDIVIDDGSHINHHVVTSFRVLFPLLNVPGLYAIEDTQTSYWREFGGDANLDNPATTMNYFKGLADRINTLEIPRTNYVPDEIDSTLVALHFYRNLIFMEKGDNMAPSVKLASIMRKRALAAGQFVR